MKKLNIAKHGVLLLVALTGFAGLAQAEPRYVSDHLIITLRAGQGDEYKILKSLPSGTKLELLEEKGDFSHVRTDDGKEGWVRTWYLAKEPTAGLLLEAAQSKAARLAAENKTLSGDLARFREQATSLQRQLNESESELQRVTNENIKLADLAGRPLELEQENTKLKESSTRIAEENKQLSQENMELRESTVQKWFMAGSGVLVLGVVLGLVLPRLRRQRSSAW